jgi:hypothetical protein
VIKKAQADKWMTDPAVLAAMAANAVTSAAADAADAAATAASGGESQQEQVVASPGEFEATEGGVAE